MIRNYIKTAWRTLVLNRTYSITNLVGLALGLMVIMVIASRIFDELSYDQQWTSTEELFRIRSGHTDGDGNIRFRSAGAPAGLGEALAVQFPEVIGHTTISARERTLTIDSITNHQGTLQVLETDSHFFNLFDTQVLEGNPKHIVAHAKNLVITEDVHQRYFGGKDVIGHTYYDRPEEGEPQSYIIRAILKNLPQNTHLYADAMVVIPKQQPFEPHRAGAHQGEYVRISREADTALLAAKVNQWFKKQQPDQHYANVTFEFQSVKDIHLRSETGWDSPMRDIYLLTGISILIVVLVCINFVNLAFAHAVKRTLETGIRKVLGASRFHLITQMATESLLLFGSAFVIAFLGYGIVLPLFENYLGHPLTITFHQSVPMFVGLLLCWLSLGLLCGLFPALTLSKTKASHELKKRLTLLSLPLNTGFTKGLVTLQFGIAMAVAICMLTMRAQLRYMETKDLGYQPENLLVVDFTAWEGRGQAFKQTLLQHAAVSSVSLALWSPFSGHASFNAVQNPENPDEEQMVAIFTGDVDFAQTMGMQLTQGRWLESGRALDAPVFDPELRQQGIYPNVLVSETTAKQLGLSLNEASSSLQQTPVGIVNDFHGASLRYPMSMMAIDAQPEWDMGCLLVRAVEGQEKEALALVTATWNEFFPNRLSRFNWVEEQVNDQYREEQKQYQQLAFFSGISMLIALLGVLGLAIYTIDRRVKEIGIRKVLGASVSSILSLISMSFAKLVFLATLLAFPVAWWAMSRWLDNFAYRIDVPFHLFVLIVLVTLCCMLIVVGIRVLRAAKANPVDSLRDE